MVSVLSSEDEFTSPEEYFGIPEGRLAEKHNRCPECRSSNVHKLGESSEGEYFECIDCGAEWKRTWDGTVY